MCAKERPEADKIEVTPEMIKAGYWALFEGGFPNEPTEDEGKALVIRVYSAMRRALK